VYPALAIADAYRKIIDPIDLLFIGTPVGCEKRLVPQSGYCIKMIEGSPLYGVGPGGKLRAIGSLAVGIAQARRLLKAHRTELVIGLGGYASAGVVLAAWSLGLRTAVHESNIVPGLANRLLGRVADRVYVGFEKTAKAFPIRRRMVTVTGNPVRGEVVRLTADRSLAPAVAERPTRILVIGGSQGAEFLNRNAPDLLASIAGLGIDVEVRHQVGEFAPSPVEATYRCAGLAATVVPYIDDMAGAYAWADFAITRSGSATIAELAVAGLPSLLVPLPSAAGDHQTANAVAFAEAGAAYWVAESDWRASDLSGQIAGLLRDPRAWLAFSRRAHELGTPGAADAVVASCEAMFAEAA
jgi:UDP-N-acetylglucosamine--N-acetylmuramyl-(pentapeptide) pyrophosphoryl-undecaprenol N-acetylglucosamine transferase